ncbi:MAG: hypothetical protein JXR37_25330 [Kiritimatiellae bacterium]|nr:hypothetical protein [Kiritimatiellia bacterium]
MNFAPSVYEHAARIVGRAPWAVSRSAELLFEAHAAAFRLYGHAPVVVGIDIYNLEAEAYGAVVEEPAGNGIPAISQPICSSVADVPNLGHFDPTRDGRIPMAIETARRLAGRFPDADVRVPVSGPFSIASNLLGFETLLCEALTEPHATRGALDHLVTGQLAFCAEIVRRGLDIAFFESAAAPPLISPQVFRAVELPPLQTMIREAATVVGHAVPCIIGGDTTPILDAILATGTGYVICPAETDQAAFMRKMAAHPDVMVRINTRPEVLVSGNAAAVRAELDRLLALAMCREKVCVGTGALPYETDPAVVLQARDYVRDAA